MKRIVESLAKRGYLFKSLVPIDSKVFKTKKRVAVYKAVDLKGYFHAIFVIGQKNPLTKKELMIIGEIYKRVVLHVGHNFKYKVLLVATMQRRGVLEELRQESWRVLY